LGFPFSGSNLELAEGLDLFGCIVFMSNHIFNGGLLNIESRGIAVPAIILAAASLASRLLGVLRDWLLANRFGASPDLDAYFAAFRIPDFIYNVLVFGGIVVAFLPLFSDYYSKSQKDAWRFANNTLNIFAVLLILTSALLFMFTPQLVFLVAPGFDQALLAKTAFLSRILFLSPIIFGLASIFSGILQYFRRFLAYSLAALLYNAGIIAGILFLSPVIGISGVAAGAVIGALFYLLVQVAPAVKCGFCYAPVFSWRESSLKQVFNLMLPRTLGIAANQINLIVPTIIGSTLAAGSIAIFNLSSNIYALPVGIIGISWATAAFASFSKYFAQGQTEKLAKKFSEAYRQIGYLTVPAVFLLFVLRQPLVDFLYYHGQFSEEAALLTSASLGIFCLGIYFSALMPVMFRLFFSARDTVSPTLSTVVSVAANIYMNFLFVGIFAGSGFLANAARQFFGLGAVPDISVLGLALAYSAANVLQFVILWFLLCRKDAALVRAKEIAVSFLKTLAAGFLAAAAVYFMIGALPQATAAQLFLSLALAGIAGAAVYFSATMLLRSSEMIYFKDILLEKWNRSSKTTTTSQKSGTL
jgi:putative peptidoglycan lipid II flippase